MSWSRWAEELRQTPEQAVADLLRGAADISPYERATPHEFLLAVLPRNSRTVFQTLLGEPRSASAEPEASADLPAHLDAGLAAWLLTQRQAHQPPARKLGAYAAQVCEALQWPLYFALPQTRDALLADRAQWLKWLASLTLTAYRDPEYDYWQVLASQQADDRLQFFWQSFVVEAGRIHSLRYLNLGLLALARLPLAEDDSRHNLRLQVQALLNRYQRRKGWGTAALEELGDSLRGVMARNPSMNAGTYQAFLTDLLLPLGDNTTVSVLSLLGLTNSHGAQRYAASIPSTTYKLKPPGQAEETDRAVEAVRRSESLAQAWLAICPLLDAHEDFMRKSGDFYYFVRNLDRCARALCDKYSIREPEIQSRLFQWIHLALRVDADDPRLWMLWELALRKAGHPQRAQWVLWEMTRRFPDHLPCRVELARLLAESSAPEDRTQAHRILLRVLQFDPNHLHAYSTLAQLAIRRNDWPNAFDYAQQGLRVDPANEHCAVLLASAHARRNGLDDLQTAIDDLQRFVSRYHGRVRAENYLRTLMRRQQLAAQDQDSFHEDDEEPASPDAVHCETDADWNAFAESIRSWVTRSTPGNSPAPGTEDQSLIERVLPLPKALLQALAGHNWDSDVLDRYDPAVQQEFILETRLWRYLSRRKGSPSSRVHMISMTQVLRWFICRSMAFLSAGPTSSSLSTTMPSAPIALAMPAKLWLSSSPATKRRL
jgi:cytochrome c-type biogenesis protein CcmH/NrfG